MLMPVIITDCLYTPKNGDGVWLGYDESLPDGWLGDGGTPGPRRRCPGSSGRRAQSRCRRPVVVVVVVVVAAAVSREQAGEDVRMGVWWIRVGRGHVCREYHFMKWSFSCVPGWAWGRHRVRRRIRCLLPGSRRCWGGRPDGIRAAAGSRVQHPPGGGDEAGAA